MCDASRHSLLVFVAHLKPADFALKLDHLDRPHDRPMVLHCTARPLQNACHHLKPATLVMDSPDQKDRHHSPLCSPRECSPRSASGNEPETSPSPARLCVTDAKAVKLSSPVTGASSSKPVQAAAPQPTHTSFMISDILHSTCSSKNVRYPTTTALTSHPVVFAASYPGNSADDSALSEGRESPRSVISDDGDCKEMREGSVGASDSDVERSGWC